MELRRRGVKAEMDYMAKSFKAQMKAADREAAKFVVICGDNELEKDEIIIKDMTDSSQEAVSREKVIEELIRRIQKCKEHITAEHSAKSMSDRPYPFAVGFREDATTAA